MNLRRSRAAGMRLLDVACRDGRLKGPPLAVASFPAPGAVKP